jgi:YesN/AraC family two-component response regulator
VLYDSIDKILIGMPAAQAQTQQAQDAAPIIQEALAYIDAHYLDNLQLSDIAARVHLSEKYFSRYFKQQVGQSFTDYINLLRINRAKNFLLHTTAPIYKIAMDLNFSDAAYFTKVFLKYEKVTPYQFRQENKAGE